ncbi:MAG: hypothetical protein HC884_15245, partial [Chloroflexaceae bacterium]|nr:hypothetical protein [Chloroflexaceae bacterium]
MKHLPPWLQDVPLPARPQPRKAPVPPVPTSSAEPEALPEWLQSTEPDDDSPETIEPSEPPGTSDRGDITVPEWLRGIQNEFGAGAESTSPAPQSSPTTARIRPPVGATDWLRSLGVEEQDADTSEASLHYEEELESGGGTNLDEQNIPDWLRDVSSEELDQDLRELGVNPSHYDSQAVTEPSPASEIDSLEVEPFHFDISAPPTPSPGTGKKVPILFGSEEELSQEPDNLVPSWMQPEHPAPPSPAPSPPVAEPGVPDWLSGIGGEPAPPPAGSAVRATRCFSSCRTGRARL